MYGCVGEIHRYMILPNLLNHRVSMYWYLIFMKSETWTYYKSDTVTKYKYIVWRILSKYYAWYNTLDTWWNPSIMYRCIVYPMYRYKAIFSYHIFSLIWKCLIKKCFFLPYNFSNTKIVIKKVYFRTKIFKKLQNHLTKLSNSKIMIKKCIFLPRFSKNCKIVSNTLVKVSRFCEIYKTIRRTSVFYLHFPSKYDISCGTNNNSFNFILTYNKTMRQWLVFVEFKLVYLNQILDVRKTCMKLWIKVYTLYFHKNGLFMKNNQI